MRISSKTIIVMTGIAVLIGGPLVAAVAQSRPCHDPGSKAGLIDMSMHPSVHHVHRALPADVPTLL
jgi:hypothetical protein